MPHQVRREFSDLPVRLRQAILRLLEDLEEKDFDELVVTGIQPPTCGPRKKP